MQVRAFVDESFRARSDGTGIYIFAAVTVAPEQEEEIRDRLRRALTGRMERFHWRADRDPLRERGLAVMHDAGVVGLSVYRLDVPKTSSERARQHVMWNPVAIMRARDVHDLVFEARERSQNKKDERTLHSISRARVSSEVFRYAFTRPLEEPLLWLADYLAGAMGEQLHEGGNGRFLASLPNELLYRHELPPLPR